MRARPPSRGGSIGILSQSLEDDRRHRRLERHGQALDVTLDTGSELHGPVPEPRNWLGDGLENIMMTMDHRQIDAEPLPAQSVAVAGNADLAVGRVLVLGGIISERVARARVTAARLPSYRPILEWVIPPPRSRTA